MPPFAAPKPLNYVEMRLNVLSAKSPAPREVLAVVGDLVRRSERHGALPEVAEKAIVSLAASEVIAALAELDPSTCDESLSRAAAEAFECAFSDSEEERELFAEAALAGLLVRDRVESVVSAARFFAQKTANEAVHQSAEAALARFLPVDAALVQKHARSLTGINPERRASLDDLDPAARERAPWFSLGLESDGLLQALAEPHVASAGRFPAAVERDLQKSTLPPFATKGGPKGFVDLGRRSAASSPGPTSPSSELHSAGRHERFDEAVSSALYRLTLGTASAAEQAFLEQRAAHDEALKLAMREARSSDDDASSSELAE